MAARQNGHCGAWSGMLHTALAHGMHILQSSTNRAVNLNTLSTADIYTPYFLLPALAEGRQPPIGMPNVEQQHGHSLHDCAS